MSSSYLGIFLAILSMVGLGVSNFLYKRSVDAIGAVNTTFYYYVFSFLIAIVIWYFFREKDRDIMAGIHWPAIIAIALYSSVITYNFAVEYLDVSIASTIRSLAFIVTVILAVIFYQEQLPIKNYIALFLAFSSIMIFSL